MWRRRPEEGSPEETLGKAPEGARGAHGGASFYKDGMPRGGTPGSDPRTALRRRAVESVYRKPDDVGVWMRMLGLFSRDGGGPRDPQGLAENMQAVLDTLGDQILPAE
jgi:hypothetical protein